MNKDHVILIPGFGMCAGDMPDSIDRYVVRHINPDWSEESFSQITEKVRKEIVSYDLGLGHKENPPRLVIYGFSIGADILMEISNSGELALRSDTLLVLADPNINLNTCFVTTAATRAATFHEFRKIINTELAKPIHQQERGDWENYLPSSTVFPFRWHI